MYICIFIPNHICIYGLLIIIAETAIAKGDSLDVYMKSVKEKLDKGTIHEIKLKINKLRKVYHKQ